ncbi:hypothetical protein A2U01_0089687, partial [Trifolium medium]|nr:hypothetical protein [Trifolium medium]
SPSEPWRDSARVTSLGEPCLARRAFNPASRTRRICLPLSEHASLAKRAHQFRCPLLRVST